MRIVSYFWLWDFLIISRKSINYQYPVELSYPHLRNVLSDESGEGENDVGWNVSNMVILF